MGVKNLVGEVSDLASEKKKKISKFKKKEKVLLSQFHLFHQQCLNIKERGKYLTDLV